MTTDIGSSEAVCTTAVTPRQPVQSSSENDSRPVDVRTHDGNFGGSGPAQNTKWLLVTRLLVLRKRTNNYALAPAA